jgi:signal transduction histidine kinase
MPGERLEVIVEQTRRLRGARVELAVHGQDTGVAMPSQAFDTVVTHLLDNAIEASREDADIRIVLRHEARRAMVDIIDEGTGMTPEFVRDELFRPCGCCCRWWKARRGSAIRCRLERNAAPSVR